MIKTTYIILLLTSQVLLADKIYHSIDETFDKNNITYEVNTNKLANGIVIENGFFLTFKNGLQDGPSLSSFWDDMYHQITMYNKGRLIGPTVTYYDDGNIKSVVIYHDGNMFIQYRYRLDGSVFYRINYKYTSDASSIVTINVYDRNENLRVFEKIRVYQEEKKQPILLEGYYYNHRGKKEKATIDKLKKMIKKLY